MESTTSNEWQSNNRYAITDRKKPFVCQQCGICFAREKAYLSHSIVHEDDSIHECVTCKEIFGDINLLTDHQKAHHFEVSNSEYIAENNDQSDSDCGMSFHKQNLLKRHTKEEHGSSVKDEKRHCCIVCGETFAEAIGLLMHAEITACFQLIKCMLCEKIFVEELFIKEHIATLHANSMTANSCKVCGKECGDGRSLRRHASLHLRRNKYSCIKCGQNFISKSRLRQHMISHRNKSTICDVCKIVFPNSQLLIQHRDSHPNVSGKLFECGECGKTFTTRTSERNHSRVHTTKSPLQCSFCSKSFVYASNLKTHEQIHTGERPYSCSVCFWGFNQKYVLWKHIRTQHAKPDSKLAKSKFRYLCTICNKTFALSCVLVQHLIQHSDTNPTLQQQTVANPCNNERRTIKIDPTDIEKYSDETVVSSLPTRSKTDRSSYSSTETDSNSKYLTDSDKLNSSQSKLMSPSATLRTTLRGSVEDDKRKTKTMITRTKPAKTNDQIFQQFDQTKPYEKSNSDHGNLTVLNAFSELKNNPAIVRTEPRSQSDLLVAQLLLEFASMARKFP